MGNEAEIWAMRLRFGQRGWDLSLEAWFWVSRLGFRPQGRDLGLEAKIWAPRLGFGSLGWDLGLLAEIWVSWLGFGSQGWDLGLKVGIWASRLGYKLQRGWTEKKKEKKEEKFLLCESIGHRPLWGRCPKRGPTDRPTNQRTNIAGCRVALHGTKKANQALGHS